MKEYLINKTGHVMRYHDFAGKDMPIVFIHGLGCAGYSDKRDDFSYTVEHHAEYLLEFIDYLRGIHYAKCN